MESEIQVPDSLARPKFVRKIAVKQRQFNFEATAQAQALPDLPEVAAAVENQVAIYEPRKKIKHELPLLMGGLETMRQLSILIPRNEIISQFISQLSTVKEEPKKALSEPLTEPKKIQRKQTEHLNRICNDRNYIASIPPQLDFQFQLDSIKKMNELSDGGVINLSKNLHNLQTPNLKLDLYKMWHTDQSNLSDSAVENLSKGLYEMSDLKDLQLGLNGWGYWNENITNTALNHITTALSSLRQLNALKLDLNMWAYENDRITDEGTQALLGGISTLKGLDKLEINMKGWGDSNEHITDESVNHLSKCLRKLGNLSEVKLVLWDKISKKAIRNLNKSLSELDNLTKVDLQFENSSSSAPTVVEENPRLNQIQEQALRKRKLMFQSHAMQDVLGGIFRREKVWDLTRRLI